MNGDTLLVNGTPHVMHFDLNRNDVCCAYWSGEIPTCPNCHEPLVCDGFHKRVPVVAVWLDDYRVVCETCEWEGRVR